MALTRPIKVAATLVKLAMLPLQMNILPLGSFHLHMSEMRVLVGMCSVLGAPEYSP
jgi:hypothetical protein